MTKKINHSQRIVSELRGALDHSIGGEISLNLESLYDFLFHEHLEILLDQEEKHIDNCLQVLTPLLNAWRSIPTGTGEKAEKDLTAKGVGPETAVQGEKASGSNRDVPGPVIEKNTLLSVSA